MLIIPALERLRQEDLKYKVSQGYIAKHCPKTKQNKTKINKMNTGREIRGTLNTFRLTSPSPRMQSNQTPNGKET
jgi:hypothetical protein